MADTQRKTRILAPPSTENEVVVAVPVDVSRGYGLTQVGLYVLAVNVGDSRIAASEVDVGPTVRPTVDNGGLAGVVSIHERAIGSIGPDDDVIVAIPVQIAGRNRGPES
jgi:hypothetical protein